MVWSTIWLLVNLVCWFGGWKILETALIETVSHVFDIHRHLAGRLCWVLALPLCLGLVVALPGLFVLPIWLSWLIEAKCEAAARRSQGAT